MASSLSLIMPIHRVENRTRFGSTRFGAITGEYIMTLQQMEAATHLPFTRTSNALRCAAWMRAEKGVYIVWSDLA